MWEEIGHQALHSLEDSLKIFALAFLIYLLLSFFEGKIASLLHKRAKLGPLLGALSGAIPQCGVPVVAADLYLSRHLNFGTLIAVFIACSDEAFPILLSDWNGEWWSAFLLLGIKIPLGVLGGYLAYAFFDRKKEIKEEAFEEEHHQHRGCCHHMIDEDENGNPWHTHLWHPLEHSLKIFIYSYVISFLFGLLFVFVGEEAIAGFLTDNIYLTPLLSTLVGLIPNCASSVLLSNMFVDGFLPFGALLSGLVMNAGLGPFTLFKNKKKWKDGFKAYGFMLPFALISGYLSLLIELALAFN